MTSNPFYQFIQFVESDRSLLLTARLKEKKLKELQNLTDTIAEHTRRVDEFKIRVSQLKLKMHACELDIKTKRTRRNELVLRLDRVSNPKEYTAVTHEIADLEKNDALLEEALFTIWQEFEAAQEEYDKQVPSFKEWLHQQQAIINENKKQVTLLEQDFERITLEKNALEKTVNQDFLSDFHLMKRSVEDPIVPLEGNHCSACQYQVSSSDIALLRKHVLVSCRECFRKLYSS